MALMDFISGMPLEILDSKLKDQRKYLDQLFIKEKALTSDLECYMFFGYKEFKEIVLGREKQRLMELRNTIIAEEVALHRELQGQINEVSLLSHGKEIIEQDLAILKIKIEEVQGKISNMTQKLEAKLKKGDKANDT